MPTVLIHGALVTAFRIPAEDKHVRLVVHEPHRFACSPKRTQPEDWGIRGGQAASDVDLGFDVRV
ncbi:hypothetical protein ACQEVB_12830 [Pseudonocardia sp. CA-107938]|uniref:hypothetical protein n=1 Tax=Pseudonocardia sp. CA-107938 TaxID=3240021 RepID=UPI003D914625